MSKPRQRVQWDPSPEEWEALEKAADRAEIPVTTLTRALIRWAWPLFESEQFNVVRLKERYGEGAQLVDRLDPNPNRRPKPAKPKAS